MKNIFSTIAFLLVACIAMAQAPQKFNYQGIARNGSGAPLASQNLGLRLTIHDATAAGATVYQETQTATTNAYGLYTLAIGTGTVVSGVFADIDWNTNDKFLQVEIDPAGGASYADAGTTQLLSVPYALRAANATALTLPFAATKASTSPLFKIDNTTDGVALEGTTASTAGNAVAIRGTVTSTSPGGFSSAVRGTNNGTGGLGIGVYGSQAGSGWGVYGTAPSGTGVNGQSNSGSGVYGNSSTGIGVYGSSSTGNAGYFSITNSANTSVSLYANTNGTGAAIFGGNTHATTSIAAIVGESNSPNAAAVEARYAGAGAGSALELENGAIKVTGTNKAAFVHTATVANKLSANGTDIDHPLCNGDANAILFVTQKLNPSTVTYNNSAIGVYYNNIRSKWEIFNQNNVAIPTNAQFNVLVIKQ